jgi:pyrroline-5-carboxylate reductase
MNQYQELTFIGGSNMARSIIAGLISSGYPATKISATAKSAETREKLSNEFSIRTYSDNVEAANQADAIVLAVKPQILKEVCSDLITGMKGNQGKLYLSIAAGVTLASLSNYLEGSERIVRTMPNTPSLLGLGMTGLYAPKSVGKDDRDYAQLLMKAVGEVVWVDQEEGINSVIAAAGSAPAYFFLFMQAIEQEAIAMGFNQKQARLLVQQTALGSAQMVVNSDVSLAELRAQVTSKGGTTAEAVKTLQAGGIEELVAKAMQAAVKRAEEMATLF